MAATASASLFSQTWLRWLAVLAVSGANFFAHLGALEVGLMEARNFVAAREMASGGSWLLPTMNGQLRLAKPPLPTWAVAAVLQLSGGTTNPALLRLPAASMALLLVLFFWGLTKELTRAAPSEELAPGRTAWLAALVLSSSLLVITVGREGHWDIFSNSLAVGSLWLLARGWNRPSPHYPSFVGAGLLLGGTILSKGPVSLYTVVLPFVGAYALSGQPTNRRNLRRHWHGTLAALLVAAVAGGAWPVYVWRHVPAAAGAVARLEAASWGERHVEPFWYYFNFAVFTGVWALVALAALLVPYARQRAARFVPYTFSLIWLLATLVLLSLVPEKKERYMLPLLPPLVVLLTGLLRYWEQIYAARPVAAGPDFWLLRGWAGLLLLACLATPIWVAVAGLPGFSPMSAAFVGIILVFGVLAAGLARGGWPQPQPTPLISISILSMSALMLLLLPAYSVSKQRRIDASLRRLAQLRTTPSWQHLPWRALDEMHIEQVWAAGRAVPTWASPTDSVPVHPTLVFAATPLPRRLPAAWQGRVQVAATDSFYLGHRREDGQFYTALLVPVLAGSRTALNQVAK
ncbi:ArnT family glycosyltransferase [Hymenobacter metallicola]|uniref:Glycosyltransferase RgtA/B/C/D-like domain-containing protein n=1 Tax=Hymenobacter metallicola TaxID=2563114 RepID=A0A4Z0QHR9_9BACT|nr:glycosyltransferase family 39 protein [Hymenobacter metallicola]TGE29026.1 hypothetical protein E5K02_06095 [Hymenobacter metallicola]